MPEIPTTATPRMISVRDAAKMLGLHPVTVRKSLPLQRVGGKSLIRIADVHAITGEDGGNGRT